jgi:hypothetical protein
MDIIMPTYLVINIASLFVLQKTKKLRYSTNQSIQSKSSNEGGSSGIQLSKTTMLLLIAAKLHFLRKVTAVLQQKGDSQTILSLTRGDCGYLELACFYL